MIYIIGNKEQNICKIGYSSRPYRRIETIRKSIPFELQIFSVFEGDLNTERLLHDKYNHCKIKGEWFYLDQIHDVDILKQYKMIKVGNIDLIIDDDLMMYHVNTLFANINKERVNDGLSQITWVNFKKQNKDFIDSFKDTPIVKKKSEWIHPFIAIEIIRTSSVKLKLLAYQNLNKLMLINIKKAKEG